MRRSIRRSLIAAVVLTVAGGALTGPAEAAPSDPLPPGTVLGVRTHGMPVQASTGPTPAGGVAPVGPSTQSAPAGAHLNYYGGRVVSNIQFVGVQYGTGTYLSQVTSSTAPNVASFHQQVSNSAHIDWLDGEYNTVAPVGTKTNQHIGRGSWEAMHAITPAPSRNGATIQDAQIQTEIAAQVAAGTLPRPTFDASGNANTSYVVFFPQGKKICDGTSCSMVAGGFCAYHGTIANVAGFGQAMYTVVPDFHSVVGCGTAGSDFGNMTSVMSHEMIETVTDAEVGLAVTFAPPLAWYDPTYGEIGDICNAQQGTIVGADGFTYVVQKEFSNALHDCIVSKAGGVGVAPTFTSTATKAYIATGTLSTITVTATGTPTPSLSMSGSVPGMTFVDNHNGSGSLSGTPTAGSVGVYALTFTASNGTAPNATLSFTLTVGHPPAITSASTASGHVGAAFTFTITSTGSPTPKISVTKAKLPPGLTYAAKPGGQGVISGVPTTPGVYKVTVTAANKVLPNAKQTLTITIT